MNKIVRVMAAAGIGISLLAGCGSTSRPAADANLSENDSVTADVMKDESAAADIISDESKAAGAKTAGAQTDDMIDEEPDLEKIICQTAFGKSDDEWDCPMTGFKLKLPESFKNLKGQVYTDDCGEIAADSGIFHARLFYAPTEDKYHDELIKALDSYNPDDDPDGINRAALVAASNKFEERGLMPFLDVFVVRDDISLDAAKEEALISASNEGRNVEFGQVGPYRYYWLERDYTSIEKPLRESFTDEYYDEFMTLVKDAENIAANIIVTEPTPLPQQDAGMTGISFETKDLDGNTVKSEELFADHKVTMINIWATWCGPCKEELATLEELNKEFAEKGCQIIGICDDTDNGLAADAKAILDENGVTYTNLVQTEEIREMLPPYVYPYTYFVDSEGNVLDRPVEGAYPEVYRARIDEILKEAEG